MGHSAILFPGQGSQLVGMGADVAQLSRRAADVFARANHALGFDLQVACFEGPADTLERTDVQQPAILVTSIACLEALADQGEVTAAFRAAAGLSLGEYTALYFAGAFTFEDVVKVVRRRGELMQEAALASPSGMVSLIGADEDKAADLCEMAAAGEVLAPANLNCPGQVVISGSKGACQRALDMAEEVGCRAVPLKVAGAFHSPLMQSAADAMRDVLARTEIRPPRLPVLSNVSGDYHGDPESIRRVLEQQVTRPVRWQACVERLIADGFDRMVEVGPNRVLTGLMRKIDRKVKAISIGTAADVEQQEILATA